MELGGVGFKDFRFNLFSPAKKRVWVEMFYHDGVKHTLLTCPLDDTTYNGCLRLINKIRRGLEWERHSMTAMGYRLRDHHWFKWQSTSWGQRYSVRFERGNEFCQNKVYVTFEYPDSSVRENRCWERKSFTSCGITQSMIYFEQRVNPLPLFERDLPTLVTRQMVEQGFLDPWAFGDGKLWEGV